jgi:hypothetical protein
VIEFVHAISDPLRIVNVGASAWGSVFGAYVARYTYGQIPLQCTFQDRFKCPTSINMSKRLF